MAAPKRSTHVVSHPNLFLKDPETGKMKKLPAGSPLTLKKEHESKRIMHFVRKVTVGENTDLTQSGGGDDGDKSESEPPGKK